MSAERKVEELYPRAPRYVIEVGDNEIVRFAHMPRGSKTMHTRIINLSESGMAFLVPYLTAPQTGDKIKVEFTAPNTDSIACFAKVVRVQVHKTYNHDQRPQTFKMVAVEFEQLHPKQRQLLSSGIMDQLKKKQADFKRQQMFLKFQWSFLGFLSKVGHFFMKLNPLQLFQKKAKVEKNDKNYTDV